MTVVYLGLVNLLPTELAHLNCYSMPLLPPTHKKCPKINTWKAICSRYNLETCQCEQIYAKVHRYIVHPGHVAVQF